jgi:ABC-type nitrate/sulfonate/bicarbonate transport system ATPase subunit
MPLAIYPATIPFRLTGSRRERVLEAAALLAVPVTLLADESFEVVVPDAPTAYQLGVLSGVRRRGVDGV